MPDVVWQFRSRHFESKLSVNEPHIAGVGPLDGAEGPSPFNMLELANSTVKYPE